MLLLDPHQLFEFSPYFFRGRKYFLTGTALLGSKLNQTCSFKITSQLTFPPDRFFCESEYFRGKPAAHAQIVCKLGNPARAGGEIGNSSTRLPVGCEQTFHSSWLRM